MDIPNAEIAFQHSVDGQVFAKCGWDQFLAMLRKFLRPVDVMLIRISVDRLLGAAVDPQIRLLVTGKTQGFDFDPPFDVVLAKGARHTLWPERSRPSNLDREEGGGDDPGSS